MARKLELIDTGNHAAIRAVVLCPNGDLDQGEMPRHSAGWCLRLDDQSKGLQRSSPGYL